MDIKTPAIVLRAFKYDDNSLIIDLLTEQLGRQSFICRISSGGKAQARRRLFQPLTLVFVYFDYRPKAHLQRLKDARIAVPFATIQANPYKASIALFLAEFLCQATKGEHEVADLYRYVENSVRWLDGCTSSFANFHLVFMMRLSRFLGFYPNLDDYRDDAWFDLRDGIFTPEKPLHADCLAPAEAEKIGLLMRMNYDTMHLFRMNRDERNRILEVILSYYRLHLPDFPKLNSVQVLRELFVS